MLYSTYIKRKVCFIQHVCLSLAFGVLLSIAAVVGLPQRVWHTDITHVTSVIAGLCFVNVLYLGWLSFRLRYNTLHDIERKAHFGSLSSVIALLLGPFGTVRGLELNAAALSSGQLSVGEAMGTAFTCTEVSILAAIVILVLYHNLSAGISRTNGVP